MKLKIELLTVAMLSVTSALPVTEPTTNVQSLSKRIPASIYAAGQFSLMAQSTPFQVFDNGVFIDYQMDSNLVVYANGVPKWDSHVTKTPGCSTNFCVLNFQSDGNLVTYFNGVSTWDTGTYGRGAWLVFFDVEPYIVIYDYQHNPVWHSTVSSSAAVPMSKKQGHGGCAESDGDVCAPVFEL